MKVRIIVCCHKRSAFPDCKDYLPLHVGKTLHPDIDLGIQADDDGDNISYKNDTYCELTGMYWAWKHIVDVDVIGLCHYRRYIKFMSLPILSRPSIQRSFSKMQSECEAVPQYILDSISKGIVITAKAERWSVPVYTNYCEWHFSDDMLAMYRVFKNTQPDNYVWAFKKVVFHSNGFSPYNMFIMSRCEFDKYCSWLFPLLKQVEEETDVSHYNSMQRRLYGYLSERLLDVYIAANDLKRIAFPIVYFDERCKANSKWNDFFQNLKYFLLSLMRYVNFRVALRIGHLRSSKI